MRAPASFPWVSHRGRRREKCPPIQLPASCAPPPRTQSAKVELGGLGCGIQLSAGKGGVRKGTVQAAGLGLGHGVRVPLPILPRPHPKSQHPGITHRAGRPAPGRSPPYPAPPHPQSRETGKPGVEPKLEFEEKSGQQNPLPHNSFLMDNDCFFILSKPSLTVLSCSPKIDQARWAPRFKLPQDNTSFQPLYSTDPGGSPQKSYPLLYTVFCLRKRQIICAPSWPHQPLRLSCGESTLCWILERL